MARANSRYYEGEVYRDADVLYHDGGNARLVYVHEQAGINCEYVDYDGKRKEAEEEHPPYRIEYAAPWYTIYDADNTKIGKATRHEEEARERLAALLADAEGGD